MENWQKLTKKLDKKIIVNSKEGPIEIALILGTDAVKGNQHVIGDVLFPHNIGLSVLPSF
jgi:beta-glucosidase